MIDLRQLEALRAVDAAGSVAGAARALSWSQPTVDYHLGNLERLVGAPVLVRSSRGSSLTSLGEFLLERALEILTLSERALEDARGFAVAGHARLRFGTFPTAAARLLPDVVRAVGNRGLSLEVTLAEVAPLVAHLNQSELDAALVYSVPGYDLPLREGIETTVVWQDPLFLAVPEGHRFANRASISRDELVTLADERWLLGATRQDPMDTVIVDAFAEAGRTIDVSMRTDDFSVMLGMIAAGMVIGLVSRLARESEAPGVALVPIDDPVFTRTLLLAAPRERNPRLPATATRHLAGAVRDALGRVAAAEATRPATPPGAPRG